MQEEASEASASDLARRVIRTVKVTARHNTPRALFMCLLNLVQLEIVKIILCNGTWSEP